MIIPNSTAPLSTADHDKVIQLFRRMPRQHIHLDWHSLEDWLIKPELCCRVAMRGASIEALLGATIDAGDAPGDPTAAWLRFAVPPMWGTHSPIMTALWENLLADLRAAGVGLVGLLDVDGWMSRYARSWGFEETNAVVTLRRHGFDLPPTLLTEALIRSCEASELERIVQVDRAAFGPLWRYNQNDIVAAFQQAACLTVAEWQGEIIAYQLSTRYAGSGHLARLAVLPEFQGHRIGGALIEEMLRFFLAKGIDVMTVNTQVNNERSQRLYRRFGFDSTGHQVPVWTLIL